MELTPNLGLKKPNENEYYNVQDQNSNMDIIDKQISDLSVPATTSKLGLIKVGTNLSITPEGTLNGVAPYVHPGSGTNPHGTTKEDVGLGNVANLGIASSAEAKAGTSDVKYMTPLKVAQYLEAKGLGTASADFSGGNLNDLIGNISIKGCNMIYAPDGDWWYVEQRVHNQGYWQYQLAIGLTTKRKKERWLLNGVWSTWSSAGGDSTMLMASDTVQLSFGSLTQTVNNNTGQNNNFKKICGFMPPANGFISIKYSGSVVSCTSTYNGVYTAYPVQYLLVSDSYKSTYLGTNNGRMFNSIFNSAFGTDFSANFSNPLALAQLSVQTSSTANTISFNMESTLSVVKGIPLILAIPSLPTGVISQEVLNGLQVCYSVVEV